MLPDLDPMLGHEHRESGRLRRVSSGRSEHGAGDEDDDARAPLDPMLISTLPVRLLSDASEVPDSACMICLEVPTKGEKVTTLPCFHTYHEACLKRWWQESSKW